MCKIAENVFTQEEIENDYFQIIRNMEGEKTKVIMKIKEMKGVFYG
jgi:hypothetical protein